MLQIIVKFGEPLRRTTGQRRISLRLSDGATVDDLLALLVQRYPDFEAAFRSYPYIIFINGRPVTAAHYNATRLQDGDIVHLALPVVGG